MSLNSTPSANRIHIGFFGRRNAGKSSLVNAVTGQALAVVSATKGTTTDPVYKAMELLPLGPVMIIDTPGFDDEGELGALRVKKTNEVLRKTDVAVLVSDSAEDLGECERELISLFKKREIPFIIAYNKSDLQKRTLTSDNEIAVSAKTGENVYELKEKIAHFAKPQAPEKRIIGDLIEKGDTVVLVVPIDSAAPKGRIILPQVQTLRDILDSDSEALVVKETELENALTKLKNKPKLVVTDSQVFAFVNKITPSDIPLTSFSILMARYKGYLETAVKGAKALSTLEDGDKVLIAEGCTHHRQCDDIGTVKIPRWLKQYTGKNIEIDTVSGTEFYDDLSEYKMVIHCGGCMLTEKEVRYRMRCAEEQGVPFTNYGIFIAYVTGILERCIEIFDFEND